MEFNNIKDFKDLCNFLNIDPAKAGYLLYTKDKKTLYKTFKIPKKSGGYRLISAPILSIRRIQNSLKLEMEKYYCSPSCVCGFIKNKSIVTNASKHIGKKWVLNIDIKDFFDSITPKRVYGLLKKRPFCFSSKVSSYFAKILTYINGLPQGGSASPLITNMICLRLDKRLSQLCFDNDITYTRYVDDLTFSSESARNLKVLYNRSDKTISKELLHIIETNGFEINDKKTRCSFNYQHQEVTGIVVNSHCNVKKFQKYKIRAMLHALEKYGLENTSKAFHEKKLLFIDNNTDNFLKTLAGNIAYLKMILGECNNTYIRIAHKYNCLTQTKRFRLKYDNDLIFNNTVFYFAKNDSDGNFISNGIAFYADDKFYTCLHCIIDETDLFNEISNIANKRLIEQRLKLCMLYSKSSNANNGIHLRNVRVVSYSIEKDLLVFTMDDYYNPYNLTISKDLIDRRKKYTLLRIHDGDYTVVYSECKVLKERLVNNIKAYPLDIQVNQGDSGSPLVDKNGMVYGYIVYGTDNSPDSNTYSNRMYTFIPIV